MDSINQDLENKWAESLMSVKEHRWKICNQRANKQTDIKLQMDLPYFGELPRLGAPFFLLQPGIDPPDDLA